MSFLTIPSQEGLFTKVKKEGSSGEGRCYDEGQCNSDEEYEDSEETNVRLIPRCSLSQGNADGPSMMRPQSI